MKAAKLREQCQSKSFNVQLLIPRITVNAVMLSGSLIYVARLAGIIHVSANYTKLYLATSLISLVS